MNALLVSASGWVFCALLAGCASVAASPGAVLDEADARHLLMRTGFGPTAAEVRAFTGLRRAQAVDKLLNEARARATTPVPEDLADASPLRRPGRNASVEERRAFVREQVREGLELRAWWVREMLATPSPLTERMTLFWHNHFVSSQQKVRIARLMYRQNVTFRAHALGNFATLLHAAAKEPAMVIYLDSLQNRRGQPNENFAREVMELFTLGEGRYGEQDVKEAARAFTGWSLERDTGAFRFRPFLHDYGTKTVLGHSGRLDGDDVLDILLAQRATATYVVRRMWREFVSPDPDEAEVARIAAAFRGSNYEIKVALRELLMSDAFYAARARGSLVKSPVELVVGTLRQLEIPVDDALPFALAAAGMGQNLFSPPNVKGWPGGDAWINSNTLLLRKQFIDRVARSDDRLRIASARRPASDGAAAQPASEAASTTQPAPSEASMFVRRLVGIVERGMRGLAFDGAEWLEGLPASTTAGKRAFAVRLLLPIEPQPLASAQLEAPAFLRAVLLDPAYELK